MSRFIYSVLVLLPLAVIYAGVGKLLPGRIIGAHVGGVPVSIWLILISLAWSVVIAWAYLRYEDRGERR